MIAGSPLLADTPPEGPSVLEGHRKESLDAAKNPISIVLHRPTYLLPLYYTLTPFQELDPCISSGQKVLQEEVKFQISIVSPIISDLFDDGLSSLNLAYTQRSYWQLYANSAYFRDSDYEPEIYFENHFHPSFLVRLGLDHESNGRGGVNERSWNRVMGEFAISGDGWLLALKSWVLLLPKSSADLHNPDITHYLGYENVLASYRFGKTILSLEMQNIESGLHRGFVDFAVSHPLREHTKLYFIYHNGYGQTLLEYNYWSQSFGIGFSLNDWI